MLLIMCSFIQSQNLISTLYVSTGTWLASNRITLAEPEGK